MNRRLSMSAAMVALAAFAGSGPLAPEAGAAPPRPDPRAGAAPPQLAPQRQLMPYADATPRQLVPGQPVVAGCPPSGDGPGIHARYNLSSRTLYCEYKVEVATSCPSTHEFKSIEQGPDRCLKVAQIQTGPNSWATLHIDPIAPSCPANHELIVDAGSSPYTPPSIVDLCASWLTVSPVLRNP